MEHSPADSQESTERTQQEEAGEPTQQEEAGDPTQQEVEYCCTWDTKPDVALRLQELREAEVEAEVLLEPVAKLKVMQRNEEQEILEHTRWSAVPQPKPEPRTAEITTTESAAARERSPAAAIMSEELKHEPQLVEEVALQKPEPARVAREPEPVLPCCMESEPAAAIMVEEFKHGPRLLKQAQFTPEPESRALEPELDPEPKPEREVEASLCCEEPDVAILARRARYRGPPVEEPQSMRRVPHSPKPESRAVDPEAEAEAFPGPEPEAFPEAEAEAFPEPEPEPQLVIGVARSRCQEPGEEILAGLARDSPPTLANTTRISEERALYREPEPEEPRTVGRVPHLPKPEPRAVESKPETEPDPEPEPEPEPDGCPRPPGAGVRSQQPKREPSSAASVTRSGYEPITEPATGPKASIERRIPLQDILFDVESACEIRIELEARAEVRFKGEYLPSRDDAMPGHETPRETTTERGVFRPQGPIRPPVEEEMCVMEPVSAMIAQQCSQEPMDEDVTPCDPVPVESAPDTWEPGALIDFEMAHRDDTDNIDPTPVGSAPPTRAQIEFERMTRIHRAPPQLHHSERIEPKAMIDVERMTSRDNTEETHDHSAPLECSRAAMGPLIWRENADVVEGGGLWPQLFFEEPDAGPSPSNGGCWPFNWRRRTPEADRRHELSHLVRAPEEESMLQKEGRPCPEEGDIPRTERPRDVQCEPGL